MWQAVKQDIGEIAVTEARLITMNAFAFLDLLGFKNLVGLGTSKK